MITKAKPEDISSLNKLINSAYRGESSKKGWTTEAELLEGSRTTEVELAEIIANTNNTLLKFTEKNQIVGCVLLIEKEQQLYLGMLTVSPEIQNSGIGKKITTSSRDSRKSIGFTQNCNDGYLSSRRIDCLVQTSRLFRYRSKRTFSSKRCSYSDFTNTSGIYGIRKNYNLINMISLT